MRPRDRELDLDFLKVSALCLHEESETHFFLPVFYFNNITPFMTCEFSVFLDPKIVNFNPNFFFLSPYLPSLSFNFC